VCIKPLLDEEAQERRNKAMLEQQQAQQQMGGNYTPGMGMGLQPVPQPLMVGMDPSTGSGGFTLPAALLAQYPALQNIDWSQMGTGQGDDGDLSDVGVGGMGRSSFDASSGGEYFDDDVSEGYVSGTGGMPQYGGGGGGQMFLGSQ
jgi:transcription factor CRZ1